MKRVSEFTSDDWAAIDKGAALYSLTQSVEKLLKVTRLQCRVTECSCTQCKLVKAVRRDLRIAKGLL